MKELYKIHHTLTEANDSGERHIVKDIAFFEYEELVGHQDFRQLIRNAVEAYEHIVSNYRDFELRNFSAVLDDLLFDRDPESLFAARSGINRHLTNMLSSTYLYTCLFRIKRKRNNTEDYSFENSEESEITHALKKTFKATTNNYHQEYYQYTFMAALRNILNHGGSLDRSTELGGQWSIRRGADDAEDDAPFRKDKKYSILDQRISKDEARSIIKKDHYESVEQNIPESFYIRETVRRYIDLLSSVHSEVWKESESTLKAGDDLIRAYLPEGCDFVEAHLTRSSAGGEHVSGPFGTSTSIRTAFSGSAKSPLYLEHYSMPGEPSAVPE